MAALSQGFTTAFSASAIVGAMALLLQAAPVAAREAGGELSCPAPSNSTSPYPTGPTIPVFARGALNVTAIGPSETVYDHNSEGCYNDLPDVGTRAYHDASCNAHLSTSETRAYRQTGPALDNLGPTDCKPTYQSAKDPNFDHETYHEWLSAVHTDDGINIYGLVHNEWYPSLVDSRCDPSHNAEFRIDSITLVVSNDGGATFHHPANYKVFRQASPWKRSYSCDHNARSAVWGPSEPSNIVKSGKYYYVMFWQGADPAVGNRAGTCAARTKDITRAGTWQVHTKKGWVDGLTTMCDPLDVLNGLHTSLSFNTYLNKFVAIGSAGGHKAIYMSTSLDMVNWSVPVAILPLNGGHINLGKAGAGQGYPSLLDSKDTSMSFENTGQAPYLYMVVQPTGSKLNTLNIVRQKIQFSK